MRLITNGEVLPAWNGYRLLSEYAGRPWRMVPWNPPSIERRHGLTLPEVEDWLLGVAA
jgi:hypothetical protein